MFNVTIEAPTLRTALQSAILCAGNDETRAWTHGIAFTRRGPETAVESTDGHVAFRAIFEGACVQEFKGEASCFIRRTDVAALVAALAPFKAPKQPKPTRKEPKPAPVAAPMVTIHVEPNALRVELPTSTLTYAADTHVGFPAVPRVIPAKAPRDAADAARMISFNPSLIARVGQAVGAFSTGNVGATFTFPTHPLDATRVDTIDTPPRGIVAATAVVMPMRH